jgi:hypothetical protein
MLSFNKETRIHVLEISGTKKRDSLVRASLFYCLELVASVSLLNTYQLNTCFFISDFQYINKICPLA